MKLTREQVEVIIKNGQARGLTGKAVLDGLVSRGYEPEGIDVSSVKQAIAPVEPQKSSGIKNTIQDIKEAGSEIFQATQKRGDNISERIDLLKKGEQGALRTAFQVLGEGAGALSDTVAGAVKGVAKVALTEGGEKQVSELVGKFGSKVMDSKEVQKVVKWYDSLPENQQRDLAAAGNIVSLVADIFGAGVATKGTKIGLEATEQGLKGAKEAVESTIKTGIKTAGEAITDNNVLAGIKQTGEELMERVPRAASRVQEQIKTAGQRSARIRDASEDVANALKVNLDERIINTVQQADDETRNAFKQVVDVAEEAPKTIGAKSQPTIVSGNLAANQYDLISKARKEVGNEIGKITKALSKTEKVDMVESLNKIDEILSSQGVTPQYTKRGVKLDFTGSKYTPAERSKIQELYNLATEGGGSLSPSKIKDKDQLFSKLKRESNFEGVGDLIIETPDGNKSLFNVFRDAYSSKLDEISPEIRELNTQYRQYSQLIEDIEDSLFKTPNFNVTKITDPAEFAKVNMRRIFGESQSSPVFESVADMMDKVARDLGYKGATPKQVAEFAEYIRKLYPETVPKTGFQGGIKAGLSDIVETISKTGIPNNLDQREALKKLLSPKKK